MIDLSTAEAVLLKAGADEALTQVVTQLTKNLIDGTMSLPKYRLEVDQALARYRTASR